MICVLVMSHDAIGHSLAVSITRCSMVILTLTQNTLNPFDAPWLEVFQISSVISLHFEGEQLCDCGSFQIDASTPTFLFSFLPSFHLRPDGPSGHHVTHHAPRNRRVHVCVRVSIQQETISCLIVFQGPLLEALYCVLSSTECLCFAMFIHLWRFSQGGLP